jgi:ATP-dependent helicase HepA
MTSAWKPGDRLTHRDNQALGAGRVVRVEGRILEVEFPLSGTALRLAASTPALAPLQLVPGQRVRSLTEPGSFVVAALLDHDQVRLTDGSVRAAASLWPETDAGDLFDRLAAHDLDPLEDFSLRVDALRLAQVREAAGLGSFLGGRIRLFPHQLHVAEHATAADPVRWLLADEVGLGKTVEACLILNHLVRTRRVERCLVVAPHTLTVQWLGELWRKYHQVFVLLDDDRLRDVAKDFGTGFNPFDAHRQVVVALETLVAQPRLSRQAVEAGIDLLVVDEAHHLRRPAGHPGDPAYRAIAPIAAQGRHVLLLTATPLEDDAHGFFRLLQLLRPADFPEDVGFEERLARAEPLPACTSSTRREDIGGLPPRVARPAVIEDEAWTPLLDLEARVRNAPSARPAGRRADRLRRALASGAALRAVLGPDETGLRDVADQADEADPRLQWLVEAARTWKEKGEKTLVFVAHRETLELLRTALSRRAQLATAAFHEDLSPGRRDIEVAQFRQPGGPSLLVSTECGGEGRNFEFCHRMVLYDLPWSPVTVEQRIGRLYRIGRIGDVEIVYFRPPRGLGAEVSCAFESIGLFREPLAGLEPELATLEKALEEAAKGIAGAATPPLVAPAIQEAQAARARVRQAAYRELHRDPYQPALAEGILARVPAGLDALTDQVVSGACARLGLRAEHVRGQRIWSVELGNEAFVDSLPGVPGGSSFLGSFSREEAVADETLDYFASGHPLVEGLLAFLEDSPRGRVSVLRFDGTGTSGVGLLALYREGPGFEAVVLDSEGVRRPEWAQALLTGPLRAGLAKRDDIGRAAWSAEIRRLGQALPVGRRPVAVAALVLSPAISRSSGLLGG